MMRSITQTSVDPIQVLPDEMLNECLSLLPPSSIAHSSAINKTWRQFVYSHPNLHNEADLSHLGFAYYRNWRIQRRDSDEDGSRAYQSFLDTFHHISVTPTLYHLTKLSINLSILWELEYCQDYGYDSAMKDFASSMSASEDNLKEINFYLDRSPYRFEDPLGFLLPLIQEIDHFDPHYFHSLKSVWIQAPVYFSIKAEGDESSKSFVLVPTMPMCNGTWEEPEFNMIKMIEVANEFVGEEGGLTDFRITQFYKFKSTSMDSIVRVLEEFTETLQNLYFDLQVGAGATFSDLWDLASSCSQLVSFFSPYEYIGRIELPERPNSDLKDLRFFCRAELVDWSMLKGWIGGSLENLDILAESDDVDLSFSLQSPISIIFDSRETLKVLKLNIVTFEAPIQELQEYGSFPNLVSLSLDVGLEMMEWLCRLDFPKLQILSLQTRNLRDYGVPTGRSATARILSLLKKHSSNLIKLAFETPRYNNPNYFSGKVPQLSFVKLMHLDLSECAESYESHFLKFLYPNLVSFSKSQDSSFSPQAFRDETMESRVEWKQKEGSNLWEREARETS